MYYLDDGALDLFPWLRPLPTTSSPYHPHHSRPLSLVPRPLLYLDPCSGTRVFDGSLRALGLATGFTLRQLDNASTGLYCAALGAMVNSREEKQPSGGLGCIAGPKRNRKMQAEDVKYSASGTKDVTVILFGWAGCKDRYLAKYSAIYEQAGYTTIRYTMPIVQVRGYFSYKLFAKQFYEHVFADGTRKPAQIVWHVFSMNGCSMWTGLWGLLLKLKRDDIVEASKGVIFDSAPAFVRPDQSARAISMSSLPAPDFNAAIRESYRAALLLYFTSHHAMVWLRSHVESRVWEKSFSYCHLQEMEIPKNLLFIYSEADEICSAESIEKIIEQQAAKDGTEIHSLKLPESPHCAHLRTHPETYTGACLRFTAEQDEGEDSLPPAITHPAYKLATAGKSDDLEPLDTPAPVPAPLENLVADLALQPPQQPMAVAAV
ncbi:hypothetical protein PRIPAC_89955 [Pristionchus pacificus]|uniref:Uncharacterized protein n=1 Tax=Pristionchus pacificus TaxID=54126 RepID=A0A2A6B985_PRIPA|nr:hypothetical protein PRIPAC_89955 [Pristionchus pacificus]|eukprot:PDM62439.1 hypothetical protein PRIPAC_51881 [Pristionchus pacificus]